MNQSEMYEIVHHQLAIDLNCTPADLMGEKDRFVFVEAAPHPAISHPNGSRIGRDICPPGCPTNARILKAICATHDARKGRRIFSGSPRF